MGEKRKSYVVFTDLSKQLTSRWKRGRKPLKNSFLQYLKTNNLFPPPQSLKLLIFESTRWQLYHPKPKSGNSAPGYKRGRCEGFINKTREHVLALNQFQITREPGFTWWSFPQSMSRHTTRRQRSLTVSCSTTRKATVHHLTSNCG